MPQRQTPIYHCPHCNKAWQIHYSGTQQVALFCPTCGISPDSTQIVVAPPPTPMASTLAPCLQALVAQGGGYLTQSDVPRYGFLWHLVENARLAVTPLVYAQSPEGTYYYPAIHQADHLYVLLILGASVSPWPCSACQSLIIPTPETLGSLAYLVLTCGTTPGHCLSCALAEVEQIESVHPLYPLSCPA